MFTNSAFIAGLVVVTQAFLLPPSISSSDFDIIKSLPIEATTLTDHRSLNLQCTTCPVAIAQKGGKPAWITGIESYLQLEFTVAHEEVDVLSMNGVQIYPPRFDQAPEPLTALQVATGTNPSDASNQHLYLGYELSFRPFGKAVKQIGTDNLELVAVHFQIAEIGDKFVDGLESVDLKLVKTSSGKLMIANIETGPTTNPPTDPIKGGADCTTLICKFRAIIDGKLSQVKPKKGCGSKLGSSSAATGGRPHKHHGLPRPSHHGHRHNHHRFSKILRTLRSVALHVLIPVLIGVTVGMTASIVGMVAGQMIIFFWRAIYRNGQGNYSQVEQEEAEEETHDDAKSFLENQELPPVYDIAKDEKTAL